MKEIQISIRNVNDGVFKEFKAETVKRGMTLGQALTIAMEEWLDEEKENPKLRITDLKPFNWGKGTENTSKEIDKIVYGD